MAENKGYMTLSDEQGSIHISEEVIAAIAVGVGTPYKAPDAASRTARFLRWFFIGSFVFCAATVMPQGETGYLFPWAGYGVRHTLRCAALGGGGCWTAAVLPLLSHAEPRQAARRARTWLPQLVAVFMIALLLLCCAYVLPATSLSERWGFVLRLQMLMNISPSTLAWSLMLITELLLFLVAFAGSGSFLCACVKRAAKLRVPLLPFALLCVPLSLIGAGYRAARRNRGCLRHGSLSPHTAARRRYGRPSGR